MTFCGPKLSLFTLIISAWGIVQLTLMGIFFYMQCVALIDDLPLKEELMKAEEFYEAANIAYTQNAYNCWIAACIFVVTFLFALHQFKTNSHQISH